MPSQTIAVVGTGIAGLVCAARLAADGREVALIGARPGPRPAGAWSPRVYALNRASIEALGAAGAWRESERVTVFDEMRVWDDGGRIRFDAADCGEDFLGVIAEDALLRAALFERIEHMPQIRRHDTALAALRRADGVCRLELESGERVDAAATVGADGAASQVRKAAGIPSRNIDYHQDALIATVRLEAARQRSPARRACWQRFFKDGVLALLPLGDDCGAVVWSCRRALADELRDLPREDFAQRLARAFEWRFGAVEALSDTTSFPLRGLIAERYTAEQVALIGDAAHVVHPLAGLGANLGIADAVALTRAADNRGLTPAALRRYQREAAWRNNLVKRSLEGLNILFALENPAIAQLRGLGLSLVNRCPPLKHWLINRAAGAW